MHTQLDSTGGACPRTPALFSSAHQWPGRIGRVWH